MLPSFGYWEDTWLPGGYSLRLVFVVWIYSILRFLSWLDIWMFVVSALEIRDQSSASYWIFYGFFILSLLHIPDQSLY